MLSLLGGAIVLIAYALASVSLLTPVPILCRCLPDHGIFWFQPCLLDLGRLPGVRAAILDPLRPYGGMSETEPGTVNGNRNTKAAQSSQCLPFPDSGFPFTFPELTDLPDDGISRGAVIMSMQLLMLKAYASSNLVSRVNPVD